MTTVRGVLALFASLCTIAVLRTQSASAVPIEIWSSGASADPLDLASSGLGSGGLLPRERWLAAGRRVGTGRYESRGGVRFEVRGGRCEIACPSGARLAIDGRGRIHGDGRALTAFAQLGLCIRFHDGTELRVQPGTEAAARRISIIDEGIEIILATQGAKKLGQLRARASTGNIYYLCGDGDELVSLVAVGPILLVRPVLVRDRARAPRIVLLGDVLREAAAEYEKSMNKRRVQYPNAEKIARLLVQVTQRMFPRNKLVSGRTASMRDEPVNIAFGPEIRVDLTTFGKDWWDGLACGLRLSAEAERSLEFVATPGKTVLYRVLPKSRQKYSRYLGRGLRFEPVADRLLPWNAPLSHPLQRKKTLRAFQPWLPSAARRGVRLEDASHRR